MRAARIAAAAIAAAALSVGAQGATADDFDVVRQVGVGSQPGPVLSAYGAAWVINTGDDTVTRIDSTTGATTTIAALNEDDLAVLRSQQSFPTGSANGAVSCIGTGSGYVWVTDGQASGSVCQLVSSTS